MPTGTLSASVTSTTSRAGVEPGLTAWPATGNGRTRRPSGSNSEPSITTVVVAPVWRPRGVRFVTWGAAVAAAGRSAATASPAAVHHARAVGTLVERAHGPTGRKARATSSVGRAFLPGGAAPQSARPLPPLAQRSSNGVRPVGLIADLLGRYTF